jgi:hypothetical protein
MVVLSHPVENDKPRTMIDRAVNRRMESSSREHLTGDHDTWWDRVLENTSRRVTWRQLGGLRVPCWPPFSRKFVTAGRLTLRFGTAVVKNVGALAPDGCCDSSAAMKFARL